MYFLNQFDVLPSGSIRYFVGTCDMIPHSKTASEAEVELGVQ